MSSSQDMREKRPKVNRKAESVYRYIIRYKREAGGDSPAMRDIMRGVGLPSTSVVSFYLERLEETGLIVRPSVSGQSRRIVIPGAEWRFDEAAARGLNVSNSSEQPA